MIINPSVLEIPTTMALAILVLLAYVFVVLRNRTRNKLFRVTSDLARVWAVVTELERAVGAVHSSTAEHFARLKRFRSRVARLHNQGSDAVWEAFSYEVEGIFAPTLQLVNEIANAQERIHYQSTYLMQFSETRTDPLTGLGNRRALDCVLTTQCALRGRYGAPFSLAIVDIDHFKDLNDQRGHLHGDEILRGLAKLLVDAARTVDIVARYGGDEFVVVMPQTVLSGAATQAERLRAKVADAMPFTVSVGVASAGDADTPESLFQRADAAMYRAKGDGRNRMFCDQGETGEAMASTADLVSSSPSAMDVVL